MMRMILLEILFIVMVKSNPCVCREALSNGQCTKCESTSNVECSLQVNQKTSLLECVEVKLSENCIESVNNICRKCSNGYYLDNNECKSCMPHCVKCSNGKECDECGVNTVLSQDKSQCIDSTSYKTSIQCNEGYYYDLNTGKCHKCINNCKRCSSNEQCIQCSNNTYLNNNECKASNLRPT